MFWPLVLPFQITCGVLAALVVGLTLFAPALRWKRGKTFLVSSAIGVLGFVPSCAGIATIADAFRFGNFHYDSYADIDDLRAKRYLPAAATDISMEKYASGYRAKYKISESEFYFYLDHSWAVYGNSSSVERAGVSGEGDDIPAEDISDDFLGLSWTFPKHATRYFSPREADGGGATYYFDADAGVVYQRTGYW